MINIPLGSVARLEILGQAHRALDDPGNRIIRQHQVTVLKSKYSLGPSEYCCFLDPPGAVCLPQSSRKDQ